MDTDSEVRPNLPPVHLELRNKLIDAFGKEVSEGVNSQRVDAFVASEGLRVAPHIFVPLARGHEFFGIIKGSPLGEALDFYTKTTDGALPTGMWDDRLDLVILPEPIPGTIDENVPKEARAFYLEGVLLHEKVHGSDEHHLNTMVPDNKHASWMRSCRVGFSLPHNTYNKTYGDWGDFLEESYSGMMVGKYTKENIPDAVRRQQLHSTGLEEGADLTLDDPIPYYVEGLGKFVPVPLKNFPVTGQRVGFALADVGGYALELMIKQRPELYDALKRARTSSQGLTDMSALIASIQPGLFGYLQRGYHNQMRVFGEKLLHVVDATEGGIPALIAGNDRIRPLWQEDNLRVLKERALSDSRLSSRRGQ